MAVALPIPLFMKDLPTTDTSRSWASKPFAAASYPFLKAQTERKTSKFLFLNVIEDFPYFSFGRIK